MSIAAGSVMQQLVLKNQIILGSVNASPDHYQMAVDDLAACFEKWPEAIQKVITEKVSYNDFKQALEHHTADEIKVVIDWTS